MDLETANKLNEVLRPLGYTVGRIAREVDAYESAIKYCNIDHEYDKSEEIEAELNAIMSSGTKDTPKWKYFDPHDILTKHGVPLQKI